MIVAAAFCPHPPVLVPEVARGAAPELDELRAACRTAITRIVRPGRRLVVVGSGSQTRTYPAGTRGTFVGFGVPVEVTLGGDGVEGAVELPLSLAVGAWLLADALGTEVSGVEAGVSGWAIGPEGGDPGLVDGTDDTALLVMGDGSARRSTAAPGYFDDRAEAFDAAVARALGTGDAAALAVLDATLGRQLLAAGVPAWRAVAGPLERRPSWDAELLHDAAPYGVGYLVAAWG